MFWSTSVPNVMLVDKCAQKIPKLLHYYCCHGSVRSKVFIGYNTIKCCGGRPYNYMNEICCVNKITRKGRNDLCCGRTPYNSDAKICCGPAPSLRFKGSSNACCGAEPFNYYRHRCAAKVEWCTDVDARSLHVALIQWLLTLKRATYNWI